jgi:azurin
MKFYPENLGTCSGDTNLQFKNTAIQIENAARHPNITTAHPQ